MLFEGALYAVQLSEDLAKMENFRSESKDGKYYLLQRWIPYL